MTDIYLPGDVVRDGSTIIASVWFRDDLPTDPEPHLAVIVTLELLAKTDVRGNYEVVEYVLVDDAWRQYCSHGTHINIHPAMEVFDDHGGEA